jgi:hypothetical protein
MTGHRDFWSLVDRRVKVRARLLRYWWNLRAKIGWCAHPAQVGRAGGDMGTCLMCGADVPWDAE